MSTITIDINEAIAYLQRNDIVAIPTETVYGLAGSAESELAIQKIFAMKKRPLTHPLILHVAKEWDVMRWVDFIPDYAQQLMDTFWPGPLTLVMKCKPGSISPLVTGGQDTIAIRSPKHPIAETLLKSLNFPLVAPSANPFGKISPTTAAHVQDSFRDDSLLILDGGRSKVGIESTIVDATDPHGYQILRHGMLDETTLTRVLASPPRSGSSLLRVPGKLASHYQPKKPLYCFDTNAQLQQFCEQSVSVYVLSFSKNRDFTHFPGYQLPTHPEQFAFELYYQLRCADKASTAMIALELPPNLAAWEGIRERLLKAATSRESIST